MDSYTVHDVSEHLKQNIDFSRFFRLVAALGSQFNDKQLRFLKAKVLEMSLEEYSAGTLEYVADNGCDFLVPNLNTKLEMKYSTNGLFTSTGVKCASVSVKLMNSNGSNTHTRLPEDYADFLLVVSKRGAAVFDKQTVSQYLTIGGDGISAKIPTAEGIFIAGPVLDTGEITEVDFVNKLDNAIIEYARSIV